MKSAWIQPRARIVNEKNNPINQSVQVLLDTGKGWLLQKRGNKDGIFWPGRYSLWGGSFELDDESDSLTAALRELYEETKLTGTDVEMIKMDVVDYGSKVYIHEAAALTKIHYYYAKLITDVTVHAYEGDGVGIFDYGTNFENNHKFTPYVADAINMIKRFKNG